MAKTTSSDDPHPTPRHSRKKDEFAKNFHLLDFGDGGRGISGGLTLSLSRTGADYSASVQNYSWNIFPVATLKISTLAVAATFRPFQILIRKS